MKNTIIVILIFALPILIYSAMKKEPDTQTLSIQPVQSQTALAQTTKPQVIKFTSPMCSSCKKLSKEFDALMPYYQDKIEFIEINVTKPTRTTNELIRQYKVTGVPVTVFIDNKLGKEQQLVGTVDKDTLDDYLRELIHE